MQFRKINQSRTRQSLSVKPVVRIFGTLLFIFEFMFCFMYGFFLSVNSQYLSKNDVLIPSSLAILAIIGFGLISIYLQRMTMIGIGFTLLLFSISIQSHMLYRQFWLMVKVSGNTLLQFGIQPQNIVQIARVSSARESIFGQLNSANIADAMACGISMIVAFGGVLGRIGPLQLFSLAVIGPIFYEVNFQLFWRLYVADCGFAMRIFLFGSIVGIISSFLLGKRQTTQSSRKYSSNYFFQLYSLLGTIIIFCFFPSLGITDVYSRFPQTRIVLPLVALNTWLALIASTLGSFGCSMLFNQKIGIHQIVFSIFSGAIAVGSSLTLIFNVAFPIAIGTITGFVTTYLNRYWKRKLNKNGVIDTNGIVIIFLIPSIFAAILSAVIQAVPPAQYLSGHANADINRSRFENGGIQIAGLFITIGLSSACGLIIGILYRLINRHQQINQFNDQTYYQLILKDD